jgi:hypothetical protein
MIKILQNLALLRVKNAIFAIFFGKNIFFNHNIGPWSIKKSHIWFSNPRWLLFFYGYQFPVVFAAGKLQQELGNTIIVHLSTLSLEHLHQSPILTAYLYTPYLYQPTNTLTT